MAKVPVWHGIARKVVWVDRPQWHDRACLPGSYEIKEPRADPLNLGHLDPRSVAPKYIALAAAEREAPNRRIDYELPDDGWLGD